MFFGEIDGNIQLDIKKPGTMRMAKQWDKFGRAVVLSPSLEVFKAQLDKAPTNLSDCTVDPALSRTLDWGPPQVPSSLKSPMILRKKFEQPF